MLDPLLGTQFADLLTLVEGQRSAGSREAAAVGIGRSAVEVTAPPHLLPQIVAPMAHVLPSASGLPVAEHIHFVVRDSDFARQVPRRWTWTTQRRADERYDFRLEYVNRGLIAVDRRRRIAILVLDEDSTQTWARPEYSRPVLELALSWRGWVSVHGGTVGDDRDCVLITAAGGRGKSSLVAGAVRKGRQTVGDDFLCLEPASDGAGPYLHSLYRTVKLAPDSPAWEPRMATGSPSDGSDGKRLTNLDDIREGCVAVSQRPVALVVPRVGDEVSCTEIPVEEALVALLPSSVAMSSDRTVAAPALTALASSLPCYQLTLARDPEQELRTIVEVLARHRTDEACAGR